MASASAHEIELVPEVFEALERLAAGDPYARVSEDSPDPETRRLCRAVNHVAENLAELVEDSHEFAMGLAEHFDVLQRVAGGDLAARIEGSSKVEILEYLGGVTNATISSLASEILARRRAEEGLARLAVAVEQSTEGVAITDQEGTLQYVNPSFEAITGSRSGEVLGRGIGSLLEGVEQPGVRESFWRALRRGEVWSGQFACRRGDGSKYEGSWTVSPVRDAVGAVTNFAAVMRDITGERELERRLSQTQRLEAIGTLAGGIAHEFNNLLTVILGFSEMALANSPSGGAARGDLERVLAAGDRARNLVRQILAFSREDDDSDGPAAIAPVVAETLQLLRASLPSTIEIRGPAAAPDVITSADSAQIQQILMNLGTNAAHAMSERGGTLSVGLEELELRRRAAAPVADLRPGRYVVLTVEDDGCGMTPEVMNRAFEPFFTTKPVGEGTGLGLAVVHGIARACGGGVALESEEGKGTTLRVLFPIVAAPRAESGCAEPQPAARGCAHILVVDDEAPIVELLESQLTRLGYAVTPCRRSSEALNVFLADPDAFDLVVSDQTMPELTGAELVREIIAVRPELPVLLCTGYSESITPERAVELGARELLLKPLRQRELAEAVRRALA